MSPTSFDGHYGDFCPGNCSLHPLVTGVMIEVFAIMATGSKTAWACINEMEFERQAAAETEGQRQAREAAAAALERERAAAAEGAKMFAYAEAQKHRNTVGKGKEKHVHKTTGPCKWLYCDEKAPKSQWRKNEKGEWCAPVVKQLTGSACWAWEYTHPKTKQFMAPHSCKHLHPGEPGWLKEWNTDRTYKAPLAAPAGVEARWFALKGGAGLQPAQPPLPKTPAPVQKAKQNTFQALETAW